ncbi:hypothetical protein HDU80_009582 [Chytriomyces hyalinus]|nr:hypothetical protein HDU80_009582 [Chytriomyces hyalinus]
MLSTGIRHYASKATTAGTRRRPVVSITDKRVQTVRDILYGPPSASTESRTTAVPAPLTATAATLSQQELMERMWALERIREKKATEERLAVKYARLRAAMEDLEANHKHLFEGTNAKEKSAVDTGAVFPRRLRVPTETPPSNGWDYTKP